MNWVLRKCRQKGGFRDVRTMISMVMAVGSA
jgi:hypothetical protein